MKITRLKLFRPVVYAALGWINMHGLQAMAEIASDPAGFCKLTFLGNSDTIISMPFSRPTAASVTVSSISNNVVEVRGTPNWTADQFVYAAGIQSNTHYLRFESGAKEGRYYSITANGTNTLVLDLGGDSLAGVAYNDRLVVVPYWTLASIFRNGNGIHASSSPEDRRTEVLTPDFDGDGINLNAVKTYYFENGFWKQVGMGSANKNDDPFLPNCYLIVRHNIATNTTLNAMGAVIVSKIGLPLKTLTTVKQDNFVGLARPVPISLRDSELISSGAFSSSATPGGRTDELLTFDNTATNHNKSAFATYYHWNGAWRRVGSGATVMDDNQIFIPGTGVIIRKGTNSVSPLWVNPVTY